MAAIAADADGWRRLLLEPKASQSDGEEDAREAEKHNGGRQDHADTLAPDHDRDQPLRKSGELRGQTRR